MSVDLKVMTLNCWGLPFPVICKNRQERIRALGEYLYNASYDIVVLEEIWVKSDFHLLREKLQKKLPFSHYFYSGAIGSGICVFSKHLITETMYYSFHLNGHPHKVFHGDWFGGKGVGMCSLYIEGLDINLYCTHFHAEYNPGQDEYEAHRLAQAIELCQFVRRTSSNCDMVIVAGDFNITPSQLGYKVITQYGNLQDVWKDENNQADEDTSGTCDVPGNIYTDPKNLIRRPHGVRIDYIMYYAKEYCDICVSDLQIGIGKVPKTDINYSDHEAVIARLSITKREETENIARLNIAKPLSRDQRESLQESLLVLDRGVAQCVNEEKFFQCMVFVLSLLLYAVNNWLVDPVTPDVSLLMAFSMACTKIGLALAIGASVWTALILKRAEFHGLMACKEDIMKLLGV
ncbi:neutral sphingomyelinase [Plakobranchus ocellatus]|uniref:sphingomyelin phosphodiesterase n=1 Tax=Plakobranchus ocellatus TaxID=259542 RepID=A0AAV3Y725_9GAST|nr:neutral sphingomyelinase [Plakobranchus ocellatus]